MTMLAELVDVVIGVDTHKHAHTLAAVAAGTGGVLETTTVPATLDGYLAAAELTGPCRRAWAIEGTGSYGRGLTRFLEARGEHVIEIDRPGRNPRRNGAKDDTIDAVRAAREALARTHRTEPRDNGPRAALAALLTTRRSAVDAVTDAKNQLHALIVSAPEPLRTRFRTTTSPQLPILASRLRLNPNWDLETRTCATTMRALARRINQLNRETVDHTKTITDIVRDWRPDLLDQSGVGPIVAATVLCAWSHHGRIRNEAAFAMLAGVAPIPASSGQTIRHRLNRHGDRQLNRAIHTVALSRLRFDPASRDYAERRRTEGKTDREIRRCLKRYIARQLYRQLETPLDET